MNINLIPTGQIVLIDANILLYANQQTSKQCMKLVERIATDDVKAILPTHILAEVMHVLMLAEAREVGIITGSNPARHLSENPNKVRSLNRYESSIRDLLTIGFRLESLIQEDFITAINLQRQYGLLTNDALMIAIGMRLRITAIVSADEIFKSIQGMMVYSPDDLEN